MIGMDREHLRRQALLGCLIFVVTGCASAPSRVKFEPPSFADRMGLHNCKVSVSLNPSEVIQNSKRSGNPSPEDNVEWIKMAADLRPGDQLRLINCFEVKGIGDPYYYALIRDNSIILKFHPMIFD